MPGFIFLCCIASIPIIVYLIIKKYLEERNKASLLALDKENFIKYYDDMEKKKLYLKPLKCLLSGLLLFFIGIGILIISYIRYLSMIVLVNSYNQEWMQQNYMYMETNNWYTGLYISIISIAFGISLIIYYFVLSKKVKEMEEKFSKTNNC
jgi:hypothetical protein